MTTEKEFEEWVLYDELRNGDVFTWKFDDNEYRHELLMMIDKSIDCQGQCLQFLPEPRLTWFYPDAKNLFLILDHIDISCISL